MDSCCLALKPNTHLANNGFLGERITGSLNNNAWVNQVARSFRTEKKITTLKPGVAYAIITSNNAKETVVS